MLCNVQYCAAETGGVVIAPRPSEPGGVIRPAMPMRPFFGIEPVILNEKVACDSGAFNKFNCTCNKLCRT